LAVRFKAEKIGIPSAALYSERKITDTKETAGIKNNS
jgi:hypothetical protein